MQCQKCKAQLKANDQFCPDCGTRVPDTNHVAVSTGTDFRPKIRNSQIPKVLIALLVGILAASLGAAAFLSGCSLDAIWIVGLVAIFIAVLSFVLAIIYWSRAYKLNKLIRGQSRIAAWEMGTSMKQMYVTHYVDAQNARNKLLFGIMAFFIVLVFGTFLLMMTEGRALMILVGLGLLALSAFVAFIGPQLFKRNWLHGDGIVMIGQHYAYINGVFHNWDFIDSGLVQVKTILEPFRGIFIQYYYTNKRLLHEKHLIIPCPADINIKDLVKTMQATK